MQLKLLQFYFIFTLCNNVNCEFYQYVKRVGLYFGYGNEEVQENINDEMLGQVVPYELPVSDEKFISEAAKLTGVALSQLDSCQHRVVLKLQTSCDKMNDEQLAKMAVMLLNCQSAVEGRKIYPCTDTMSIKDCTVNMDPDTWNSYHLMSNRARAVCYSVRQSQFRGLTEYTINRLMTAARNQLFNLDKISKDQENLHEMAQQSLESVAKGQEFLVQQQKDFQQAQLHNQLALENNIQRLSDEKRIIKETNEELMKMTHSVQGKIEQAAWQLRMHTDESRVNHQELIDDLIGIQNKVQIIFQQIQDSSELLLKQSEMAHQQYKATLTQLVEVNATVHSLVSLVGGTRKALEERLIWINNALGGTDLALERLYAISWHTGFLLVAMISCAFLGAQTITRLMVTISLPLNLALTLQHSEHALNPLQLSTSVGACILIQLLVSSIMVLWQSKMLRHAIPMIKEKLTPQKQNCNGVKYVNEEDDYPDSLTFTSPLRNEHISSRSRSRTPLILNGSSKSYCSAKTRLGTPCKLTALTGRNFCYRHQTGDSIYGD
ncbi:hypothetical protein RN001_008499 [Aquatica leii]|uniref:Protein brambleberry n=1 Tax=Aquatica leii TaxID=1421715 RepID=A0AAN7QJ17_9COLE|nr:hypothetical protein RN001_008499 [Aquatica leii]